jgi:hypothetical protein
MGERGRQDTDGGLVLVCWQYLVLGSGEDAVNGTYNMRGFRNRAPWFSNSEGVMICRDTVLASPSTGRRSMSRS